MTITARYAATCASCHQPIAPGQQIEWTKGVREVRHTDCGQSQSAATDAQPSRRAYRPTSCRVCGYVQQPRNRRGYIDGDRILRSGECQSCYEERKMGY